MSNLTVSVPFTKNGGQPATGLAVADIAMYLTAQGKDSGLVTVIWNGTVNPQYEISNTGAYTRIYSTADLGTYNYFAVGVYSGAESLDSNYTTVGALALQEIQQLVQVIVTEWFY